MIRIALLLLLVASAAHAEVVVAVRTIPANTIITADDISLHEIRGAEGETDPYLFVGMEARIALYSGRPLHLPDVRLPAIVERNQIIPLKFQNGNLIISTDGRSLARASPGEIIRVLNLASRTTVSAKIGTDGVAYVSQ